MGFFDLDCVGLMGATRADADYMAEGTCAYLLDEFVLSLYLLFYGQHGAAVLNSKMFIYKANTLRTVQLPLETTHWGNK
jgi:hypothetical protein